MAATAPELILRSRRVVTPRGVAPATVFVRGGRIDAVRGHADAPAGANVLDAGDDVVMPGVVDTHVHVNEPGRTDWEGFRSATRAAAAGGVTTLVDMPLNSIPATTTRAALEAKREAAAGQLAVDVGFWGGVVPGNAGELEAMARAGVRGFKCFLVESGVEEFGCVREGDLRAAMPILARAGVPLLVHAEAPEPIEEAERAQARAGADPRRYATWLGARPRAAEDRAVERMVRLCRETGARTHVVHLSSSGALGLVAGAKAAGLPFTAETCPHYLHFASEEIPDGATHFKCAPPIRERENRERLWAALGEGTLELVVSDHSPCAPALRKMEAGDFGAAWGGVAGLQLALSVVWTGARTRGHDLAALARWMCERPAALAGLSARKGRIEPGLDADLVVWRPEAVWRVEPERLSHRHKTTPYAGEALAGVVETTFVRGNRVYERGTFSGEPVGQIL